MNIEKELAELKIRTTYLEAKLTTMNDKSLGLLYEVAQSQLTTQQEIESLKEHIHELINQQLHTKNQPT
jgi:flagellar basal body-associated protein FliL|tara:strand:+ start:1199 stop:1405 length:207 start_codon:yes stop_codon:yes gene_type:complete